VYLGTYDLTAGARVQVSNIVDPQTDDPLPSNPGDGTIDIAYDSIGFISTNGTNHTCGNAYG
jgi:hypothetical protein